MPQKIIDFVTFVTIATISAHCSDLGIDCVGLNDKKKLCARSCVCDVPMILHAYLMLMDSHPCYGESLGAVWFFFFITPYSLIFVTHHSLLITHHLKYPNFLNPTRLAHIFSFSSLKFFYYL